MTLKQLKKQAQEKNMPFIYRTKHHGIRVYLPWHDRWTHIGLTFDKFSKGLPAMTAPQDPQEAYAAHYALTMLGYVVNGSTDQGFLRFN